MKIVWDEPKRQANLVKHGLDFEDLIDGFDFAIAFSFEVPPSRTGRRRRMFVGEFAGELVVAVIASPLGSEALSVVSFRPASRDERMIYGIEKSRRLRP